MRAIKLLLAAVGLAMLVAGMFIGFVSPTVAGIKCGAPFLGEDAESAQIVRDLLDGATPATEALANQAAGLFASCNDALNDRQIIAWTLVIGGGVLLVTALIMSLSRARAPGQHETPSTTS